MNKKYKYLLFDLDGTLTDPKEGITKSFQYALESLGIHEPNLDNLTKYIGPPLRDSFCDYFSGSLVETAVEKYRERFTEKGIHENSVYDGIPQLLEAVKNAGKSISLATSKPEYLAVRILEDYKLAEFFDCMTGGLADGKRDTKASVIREVFERLNIQEKDKNSVLMIGDRKYDIEGAIICGIDSVGVKFGYAEDGELEKAGATYIVSTVDELQKLLLSM